MTTHTLRANDLEEALHELREAGVPFIHLEPGVYYTSTDGEYMAEVIVVSSDNRAELYSRGTLQ